MTFRGTVINGVVVPDSGQVLPEGARVAVNPIPRPRTRTKSTSKGKPAKTRAKAQRQVHPLTALAGIWKDRPDWKGKSSVQVVAELRRSSGPRRG